MPCETQEFFSIVFVFFQRGSFCYTMRRAKINEIKRKYLLRPARRVL